MRSRAAVARCFFLSSGRIFRLSDRCRRLLRGRGLLIVRRRLFRLRLGFRLLFGDIIAERKPGLVARTFVFIERVIELDVLEFDTNAAVKCPSASPMRARRFSVTGYSAPTLNADLS